MLPGYNHNVQYNEQVFHVQTEDSGVENPHIITHIFLGGDIVASRKTPYAELLERDNLEEVLTQLMQDQHKNLMRELKDGQLDDAIATREAAQTEDPGASSPQQSSEGADSPTVSMADLPPPMPINREALQGKASSPANTTDDDRHVHHPTPPPMNQPGITEEALNDLILQVVTDSES